MIELIGEPVYEDKEIYIHQELVRTDLYRVRAPFDIPEYGVKAGDLGGLCDKSANIVDCIWIDPRSVVYGKSLIVKSAIFFSRVTDSEIWTSDVKNDSDISDSTVTDSYLNSAYVTDSRVTKSSLVNSSVCGNARVFNSFIKDSSVGASSYSPSIQNAEILSSNHFLSVSGLGSENVTSIVYRTFDSHAISVGCWNETSVNVEEFSYRQSTLDDLAKAVDDREKFEWVYMDGYTKEEGQFWRDQYALFEQLARLTIKDWHNV